MISFVFGGANTASGAQVAVRLIEVEGANVQRSDIDVLRSLLESDLIEHPDVRLLSDDDPTPAEMDISAKITRLGNSYLVILTAQFSNGKQRSRKHKLADFDEIDIATRRLVAALVEDIDFFATVSRGEVLEVDSSPESLVKATRGFEVGFGPAWPISDALRDNGTMYGFHAAIVWDIRDVLIDLRTDFQFGEDHVNTFAFTATVGGRYVWYDARRYALYSVRASRSFRIAACSSSTGAFSPRRRRM